MMWNEYPADKGHPPLHVFRRGCDSQVAVAQGHGSRRTRWSLSYPQALIRDCKYLEA